MVEIEGVRHSVAGFTILDDVSVSFPQSRLTVIVGPNGAGKSTLMKIASGLVEPSRGAVRYGGRPVNEIDSSELARKRAVLSQGVELAFALTVEDVVMIGRFPHYAASPSRIDFEVVDRAIQAVDLDGRRKQPYPTLSGGEKQKVQLARVLAQLWQRDESLAGRVLFLDEPVTGLDIHYQIHILDIARRMLAQGCTVVAILHDLNLGFEYADRTIIVNRGRIAHETDDASSIPPELIESVFSVRAERAGGYWRFSRKS
jgi:iron complex transport system ATP-binding protein